MAMMVMWYGFLGDAHAVVEPCGSMRRAREVADLGADDTFIRIRAVIVLQVRDR